jgi:3,4-dihydroxy 2-butanone 4-phosphate synthase/GTP cyclohydrolase II
MSPNALTTKLKGGGASPKQLRQYGIGAQILGALGVSEMIMLTNSPAPKVVGLEGYGITIIGTRRIPKRGG